MTSRLARTPLLPLAVTLLISAPAVALADEPAPRQDSAAWEDWAKTEEASRYRFYQQGPEIPNGQPLMRRNKAMVGIGGGAMGLGFVSILAGMMVGLKNLHCDWGCSARDRGTASAAEGMMLGGLATLVVGVPILVLGLRKTKVREAMSFVGAPTAGGWGWKF